MDRPGPSTSSSKASELLTQSLVGMRAATSISEWELQAVLFRANLTQYYDVFISQGGDDIYQLMECDENEFLEIMSLVGMSQKPLHVRRLQRTLAEFSRNRANFLRDIVPHIGPPPLPHPSGTQAVDSSEVLRILLSQPLQTQVARSSALFGDSPSTSTAFRLPFLSSQPTPSIQDPSINLGSIQSADILATIASATSMQTVKSSPLSFAPVILSPPSTSGITARSSSLPSTSGTALQPQPQSQPQPTLSDSDIERLRISAALVLKSIRETESKHLQQPQRKPSKDVQSALLLPLDHPDRSITFRQLSAIYGRRDSKRGPPKPLLHHDILINEAAAQICLERPDYLTRRNELFSLARKVSRMSGLQQHHIRDVSERSRQLLGEKSDSPSIRSTPTPDEFLTIRSKTSSVEPTEDLVPESTPTKRRKDSTGAVDPKKSKQT